VPARCMICHSPHMRRTSASNDKYGTTLWQHEAGEHCMDCPLCRCVGQQGGSFDGRRTKNKACRSGSWMAGCALAS
jgi:hypothetical protein